MRADRLLSLLMLLQSRGRMSAKALATRLEVSERTIYRDIDALSVAGVPVYGEPGREGGFDLLDSYRTSLTGLNEAELRALFMLSVPAPLTDLEVSGDLQTALLKLSASLPDTSRESERLVRQRFHLDWNWWHRMEEPVPFLRMIEKAVWQDRRMTIRFRPFFLLDMEQVVDPYGLVAKAGVWYMVYAHGGRMRAMRAADLLDARMSDETFKRLEDFNLAEFWAEWCTRREQSYSSYPVIVLVGEDFAPSLPNYFSDGVRRMIAQDGSADETGRIRMEIYFESLPEARAVLLGFGGSVEVLEPQALRASMADYAWRILGHYQ